MRIANNTRWVTLPMRKIITRLGRKPGRHTPRVISISHCCLSDCRHGVTVLGQWDAGGLDRFVMWIPAALKHSMTSVDFAEAADELMRRRPAKPADSIGLQRRVSREREYAWANEFPMELKLPMQPPDPKVVTPKPKPTKADILRRKIKSVEKRLAKHHAKEKAALAQAKLAVTLQRKTEREKRVLERRLAKLEGES